MTQVVYLHVGGPKSGTTFVQQVLEHNRETLADAGVLVVGPRLDLIHSAMVIRGDRRLDSLPDSARSSWRRVTEQVKQWPGRSAIISYELLANASAAQVETALADLSGVEVHVVITTRDLGKAIGSSWQEQLKFGVTRPLESWSPPQESAEASEWGWRTLQPANIARRWGASLPADRVHVVTVPKAGGSDELWHRFAQACDLSGVAGIDASVERVNESLGVVQAELLRRVNEAVDGRIAGGRAKSLWLRDLLAHRVLAPLGREAIGTTPEHHQEAVAQYAAATADIEAAGWTVHGDLADLEPTETEGRLPGEVSDREVAESAALALADLVVWAKEAGADPAHGLGGEDAAEGSPESGSRAKEMVKSSLARITAGPRDRQVERLRERVAALEAEVEQSRRLHLRVATLSDVVQELLLPAAQRREELSVDAIRDYRDRSL